MSYIRCASYGERYELFRTRLLAPGFAVLVSAWPVLYTAEGAGRLAAERIYTRRRQLNYFEFILITFCFFLQWPNLLALLMFPVLVFMHVRLALSEERQAAKEFGRAVPAASAARNHEAGEHT